MKLRELMLGLYIFYLALALILGGVAFDERIWPEEVENILAD